MSIEQDIVADRLKGHTYAMSSFQLAEVQSHIDPELWYIIENEISRFSNALKQRNQTEYRIRDLFNIVSLKLVGVIAEREGFDVANIRTGRNTDAMFDAYLNFKGNKKDKSMMEIIETFLLYGIADVIVQGRYFKKSHV